MNIIRDQAAWTSREIDPDVPCLAKKTASAATLTSAFEQALPRAISSRIRTSILTGGAGIRAEFSREA
jgi:hypothetical protein